MTADASQLPRRSRGIPIAHGVRDAGADQVLRDGFGCPLEICGYAALYGARSAMPIDVGGVAAFEYIVPGAFDFANFRECVVNVDHNRYRGLCGRLRVRPTLTGLAFVLSGIVDKGAARAVLAEVAGGRLNRASIKASMQTSTGRLDGELAHFLRRGFDFGDICLTTSPVYPAAGCWISTARIPDSRLRALRTIWEIEGCDAPDSPWIECPAAAAGWRDLEGAA